MTSSSRDEQDLCNGSRREFQRRSFSSFRYESKEQCVNVLTSHPTNVDAWRNLSIFLRPDDTAVVGSRTVSKLDCALEAVNLDRRVSMSDLGVALEVARLRELALPDGTVVTPRTCYIEGVSHRPSSYALLRLCRTMAPGESVTINSVAYTKQQLLWEAFKFSSSSRREPSPELYVDLACGIPAGDSTARVLLPDGSQLSRLDCLTKAVMCARSWVIVLKAISLMGHKETITLMDGAVLTQKDLLVRLAEKEPRRIAIWRYLAESLHQHDTVTINGVAYTKQQLLLVALQLQPQQPETYRASNDAAFVYAHLAATIPRSGNSTVTLHDGTHMSRQDCLTKAVALSTSWKLLKEVSFLLPDDNTYTIVVHGTPMTRVELIVMAIDVYPTKYSLFERLAQFLPNDTTVQLKDGRVLSRQDCVDSARYLKLGGIIDLN